jgi:hypothetical protein
MNKLFNQLQLTGSVYSKEWSMVMKIVESLNNGTAKVIDKKWLNWYENNDSFPLDLHDIKTWSTFDRKCIFIEFYIFENKLTADCTIYDGKSYDGSRTTSRFYCKLSFDKKFIEFLESKINYAFNEYCEDAYCEHLEAEKKIWIDNFKNNLNYE